LSILSHSDSRTVHFCQLDSYSCSDRTADSYSGSKYIKTKKSVNQTAATVVADWLTDYLLPVCSVGTKAPKINEHQLSVMNKFGIIDGRERDDGSRRGVRNSNRVNRGKRILIKRP